MEDLKKLENLEHLKNVGYIAGAFTSLAFLPQVDQVYKTKSIKDISLLSLIIFFLGQIMWIAHGLYVKDYSIFIFAIITGTLYIYLIYAKLKYK